MQQNRLPLFTVAGAQCTTLCTAGRMLNTSLRGAILACRAFALRNRGRVYIPLAPLLRSALPVMQCRDFPAAHFTAARICSETGCSPARFDHLDTRIFFRARYILLPCSPQPLLVYPAAVLDAVRALIPYTGPHLPQGWWRPLVPPSATMRGKDPKKAQAGSHPALRCE